MVRESTSWALTIVAIALAFASLTRPIVVDAQPDRDQLLARLAASIADFVHNISNVVAEEHYHQEAALPRRTRNLRSDFLLVRYPGSSGMWLSFRDVFEVDGKPVRDEQEERLTKLFFDPFSDAVRRARDIASASARYNIDGLGNVDNPLLALSLMQSAYQPRFRYTVLGLDKKVGAAVRIIEFREFQRPTVVRDGFNDLLARGLVWLDERSGRVIKTELRLGGGTFPLRLVTTFILNGDLGIDVPSEMEGWYPGHDREITTKASYSRFRRFQVRTEEALR